MTDPARLLLPAIRLDRDTPDGAAAVALQQVEEGVGGFLLFGGSTGRVRELVERLRRAARRPLWFAADLERGAGQQFDGAATLPPPAALAAHPRPAEAVRLAARLTALEARSLGVNWALAPVLDLDVEARNPIVGTRSFGRDPAVVAVLGRAWVEACQEVGVAACAKHFPGHGRTTADSHAECPVVEAPRAALEDDLAPFRAVADRIASVMTAHVAYPTLGADGPATLSRAVLVDLLRGELGFGGLVVSDALIMAGVAGAGETGAATQGWRAVRAVRAGCDLLLYPGDSSLIARTLRQAAGADPALARKVEDAVSRSAAALGARATGEGPGAGGEGPGEPGSDDLPLFSPEVERITELAAACVRTVGDGEGRGAATGTLQPWLEAAGPGRVRVEVLSDDGEAGAARLGEAFTAGLRRRGLEVEVRGGAPRGGVGRAHGSVRRGSAGVPVVLLLEATPRAWKGRAGVGPETAARVDLLVRAGPPVLPVVLGHPRVLEDRGMSGVCAWASEAVMERGAAAWLTARLAERRG